MRIRFQKNYFSKKSDDRSHVKAHAFQNLRPKCNMMHVNDGLMNRDSIRNSNVCMHARMFTMCGFLSS
jgi:hypothetical protein